MFKHEKQPVHDHGSKINTYLPKLADVVTKKKQENNAGQNKSSILPQVSQRMNSRKAPPADQKKSTFLSRQLSRNKAADQRQQGKKPSFLNRMGQKQERVPKKKGNRFGKQPAPETKNSLLPQVANLVNHKKQEPADNHRGGFLNRLSGIGAH